MKCREVLPPVDRSLQGSSSWLRVSREKAAKLREEDYQLAYAIDILKGLSALGPEFAAALAQRAN